MKLDLLFLIQNSEKDVGGQQGRSQTSPDGGAQFLKHTHL